MDSYVWNWIRSGWVGKRKSLVVLGQKTKLSELSDGYIHERFISGIVVSRRPSLWSTYFCHLEASW